MIGGNPTATQVATTHTVTGTGATSGTATATVNVTVNTATTTALTSTPNPSIPSQTVTLTATVSSASGSPPGTVAFKDNGVVLAGCSAVVLTAGTATCPTSTLTVGSHPLTAHYSGDPTFAASTGMTPHVVKAALDHAITATAKPARGGTVSCTPNPVPHGNASACTATARNGYAFAGWRDACAGQSSTICRLIKVTAAQTVTAIFTDLSPALPTRGGWRAILQ